jgi:hypothetical protein
LMLGYFTTGRIPNRLDIATNEGFEKRDEMDWSAVAAAHEVSHVGNGGV